MDNITASNSTKKYYFVVHTCDEYLAGTDSNIFVTLHGEKGTSESQRLNGHISGNAFERDSYECFSVSYDHDVGEVYKITIHTDGMYAGSDWKCDYFHISTHNINKSSTDCCKFIINEWITDSSKKYEYIVTSGYPYFNNPVQDNYVVVQSGEVHVPANATYRAEVKTSLTYAVDYSSVATTEINTGTSIAIDYDVIKANFDYKIRETVETTSHISFNQTVEFTSIVEINDKSDKPRKYAILWNERRNDYSVNMGAVNFSFLIPVERTYAGLRLIE